VSHPAHVCVDVAPGQLEQCLRRFKQLAGPVLTEVRQRLRHVSNHELKRLAERRGLLRARKRAARQGN